MQLKLAFSYNDGDVKILINFLGGILAICIKIPKNSRIFLAK